MVIKETKIAVKQKMDISQRISTGLYLVICFISLFSILAVGFVSLVPLEAPLQVTGLTVTGAGPYNINLQWNTRKESGISYYKIYRNLNGNIEIKTVSQPNWTPLPDTISYMYEPLLVDTNYSFQVSAVNTSGEEGQLSVVAGGKTLISYNNLDELFRRNNNLSDSRWAYPAKNSKPYSSIYDFTNKFYQPEIVVFKDTEYNTESWKMTNDPGASPQHDALGKTPFNSNGSVMVFMSKWSTNLRCFYNSSGVLKCSDWSEWTMNIDGSNIKKVAPAGTGLPAALTDHAFHAALHKNNPKYMYVGYYDGLYQIDISNNFATTKVQEFNFTSSRRKTLMSVLTDDNIVMVKDNNPSTTGGIPDYIPNLYFVRLDMPEEDGTDTHCHNIGPVSRGGDGTFNTNHRCFYYDIAFGIIGVNGHSTSEEYHLHDINFRRDVADSYTLNFGPQGDVGEYITFEVPLDGNPANIKVAFSNNNPVIPYFSHPFFNKDGSLIVYFGEGIVGDNNWELNLRDYALQETDPDGAYLRELTNDHEAGGGHTSWDGYDNQWVHANVGSTGWSLDGKLIKADTNIAGSAVPMVTPHSRGSANYYQYPRPDQSPDATKVYYASNMLNSKQALVDSYIAISKKPYPPQTAQATTISSSVTLTWTPHSVSREVKGYHVYRTTTDPNNPNLTPQWEDLGLVSGNSYPNTGLTNGTVYYYGITSEENSRLESDELSNIVKVTVGSSGSVNNNYTPQGKKNFDKKVPDQVSSLSMLKIGSGQFRLTWTQPADTDIQHYNIYYSVNGNPAASQQNLILSPPVGITSILDWQARTDVSDASQYYGITAVDRQGNESLIQYLGGAPPLCTDSDHDGYGNPASTSCLHPELDCNDTIAAINPGATETCNNVDDNCNGQIDEGFDTDNDGYTTCSLPIPDCNNNDALVHPGGTEICSNSKDDDCVGGDAACSPCSQGPITQRCACGGSAYESGYCCSNVYSASACQTVCNCGASGAICTTSLSCIGTCSSDCQTCNDTADDNCPNYCNTDNLSWKKPVSADLESWGQSATKIVDGILDQVLSYWAAEGANHYVTIDLGGDKKFNKLYVSPAGRNTGDVYYYNGAWEVKYATSSAPDTWLDFSNVTKTNGTGGTLSAPGLKMFGTNPGHHNSDNNYKFYSFTFDTVEAKYLKYTVTTGDSGGDTNGDEIEVYYCDYTPTIYNQSAQISGTTADIKWLTNRTSDSKIIYGTSSSNLNQAVSSSNYLVQHEAILQNLNTNTIYYYKIKSCYINDCQESSLLSFKTPRPTKNKFIEISF